MEISPYLIAGIVAWFGSQGAKYVIATIKARNMRQFRQLYLSGNMPSAHTATVVSITTVIGLIDGVGGGLFALAAIFSAVVMYDAVMVRRSSGEQGEALSNYLKEMKSKILLPRIAKGHKPAEVLVGAAVGIAIGYGVFFLTLI